VLFSPEKVLTRSGLKVYSSFYLFGNATIVAILTSTLMLKLSKHFISKVFTCKMSQPFNL